MIRVELLTAPEAVVAGLSEKAKRQMPDIHVEEVDVAANPAVAVKYRVIETMEGRWDLTVRVVSQSRRLELPLREEVGR